MVDLPTATVLTATLANDDPTNIAGRGSETHGNAVSIAEDDPAVDAVVGAGDDTLYAYTHEGELSTDSSMTTTTLYTCKMSSRKDLPISQKGESRKSSLLNYDNARYAKDKQTKKDDQEGYLDNARDYSSKSNIVLQYSILRPAVVEETATAVDEPPLRTCKASSRKDLPIAQKGKSSKTLTRTSAPDVKQSLFMREIRLCDVPCKSRGPLQETQRSSQGESASISFQATSRSCR